jgi:hypothetical protein
MSQNNLFHLLVYYNNMARDSEFRNIVSDGLEALKLVCNLTIGSITSTRLTTSRWPAYHGIEI